MKRASNWITVGLLALAALSAAAQETPRPERERERARTEADRARAEAERTYVLSVGPEAFTFTQRRGRLGVSVDLRPDAATDSVGARIVGVTPGGAADRAGVRSGDVVVRLNGTRLAAPEARSGDVMATDQSRPGMRLVRMAARLDPGDTVRLELRRDGRPVNLTFVAEESDIDRLIERVRVALPRVAPTAPTPPAAAFSGAVARVFMRGIRDLELVKVNEGLGSYFGTSEGLLVVDVGADTALGLRSGDVILAIGGRRPTSPSHAMRILATYEPDEQVSFDVMRNRRRMTVQGRVPRADGAGEWRVEPNAFEFTLPRFQTEPLRRLYEHGWPRIELDRRPGQIRITQPKALISTEGEV
jgi:hypothetical protein